MAVVYGQYTMCMEISGNDGGSLNGRGLTTIYGYVQTNCSCI
jgi:hypothetical protein